jgi:Protein of unknown function (DUF3305)
VSPIEPLVRIPVGVVVERRKAKSPWVDFVWRPLAVLPGVPDAAPWTVLDSDADRATFYGGAAEIELYRSDVPAYCANLATGAALLWVVLRPTGLEPPYEIAAVTAEPGEGESFTEGATNLVETVPMPEVVYGIIADFVAAHQVERPFVKRQRDRVNPEAMARPAPLKDRK